jgi:hypothetical protein
VDVSSIDSRARIQQCLPTHGAARTRAHRPERRFMYARTRTNAHTYVSLHAYTHTHAHAHAHAHAWRAEALALRARRRACLRPLRSAAQQSSAAIPPRTHKRYQPHTRTHRRMVACSPQLLSHSGVRAHSLSVRHRGRDRIGLTGTSHWSRKRQPIPTSSAVRHNPCPTNVRAPASSLGWRIRLAH